VEEGRSERILIWVLGSVVALLIVALAVVLLAGAGDPDADGETLSASRIGLDNGGTPDTSTTTTESPGATTTTTDDPETTTTTTTTTAPTTTTTTSTTTTTPERQEIEIGLDPADAVFNEGSGPGTASRQGYGVSVYVITEGLDGSAARTAALVWSVPRSAVGPLEGNYRIRVGLRHFWNARLTTGPNPGRSASWSVRVVGSADNVEFGRREEVVQIGRNEADDFFGNEPLIFDNTMPDDWDTITVRVEISCAVTAGSNVFQIGESSLCDGRESDRGFVLRYAWVTFLPVD
jgi:hypothetical protein